MRNYRKTVQMPFFKVESRGINIWDLWWHVWWHLLCCCVVWLSVQFNWLFCQLFSETLNYTREKWEMKCLDKEQKWQWPHGATAKRGLFLPSHRKVALLLEEGKNRVCGQVSESYFEILEAPRRLQPVSESLDGPVALLIVIKRIGQQKIAFGSH